MDIHKNARLSYRSREALARFVVEQGATRTAAGFAAGWVSLLMMDSPLAARRIGLFCCLFLL